MIIYISNENESLISCLKNTVNANEIQSITGVKYLKKFVLQEMKNIKTNIYCGYTTSTCPLLII
jgi:hypothetical protein